MQPEKIIMGIDPGTTIMGYGMIRVVGKKPELLTMGVIRLSKIDDHALKLQRIFDRCVSLIDEFHPDEVAAEAPFFGQNVQSMLKLGRAQGVALAAALSRQIPVTEYAPRKIKQAITGNGAASKEQVAAMLCSVLKIPKENLPKELDATDGLAAALCHHFQSSSPQLGKSYSGWKAYIKDNPSRTKKSK
ncbi:crossover junction endodeoxyribonuclease RuvC [Sanyastnella coralliicola]|uniref:crossover junction endodeoxyribonuclease RuvC n=1 Tax=Sanyastnella coralliicola TaxID=3069118 RepID=UPI0027BA31DE|nr:crossover junction endodeoxyribonuclease RuvC [Longitalea sp. SCSIO 12813]